MKKTAFLLLLVASAGLLHAQSLGSIEDALSTDPLKAKELIDKYMTNAKNAAKPEAWFWKGSVYAEISKHDSLQTACPDCRSEAFNAFRKYQEMDPKSNLLQLKQNQPLFEIYDGYFNQAVKLSQSKNYAEAYASFQNALAVEEYIHSKDLDYRGFRLPAFDTTLLFYTAITARAAKKDSDAVIYYNRIADANIPDSQYEEAYQYPVDYYRRKRDQVNFDSALAKGKKLFPGDRFWTGAQVDWIEASGTKEDVLKAYEEAIAKEPDSYYLNYNYGANLYNYIFANEKAPANTTALKARAYEQIKKALALQATAEANMLMASFLYNSSSDYSTAAQKITSTQAAAQRKRQLLADSASMDIDQSIVYAEAAAKQYEAMSSLTATDKVKYRQSLNMLHNLYLSKHNDAQAALYGDKLKAAQ